MNCLNIIGLPYNVIFLSDQCLDFLYQITCRSFTLFSYQTSYQIRLLKIFIRLVIRSDQKLKDLIKWSSYQIDLLGPILECSSHSNNKCLVHYGHWKNRETGVLWYMCLLSDRSAPVSLQRRCLANFSLTVFVHVVSWHINFSPFFVWWTIQSDVKYIKKMLNFWKKHLAMRGVGDL